MNTHTKTLKSGIVATLAMTALMLAGPMVGMPKMNIGAMLAAMMGGVLALGWMIHFVIGIIFAYAYIYFLNARLPVTNNLLRGSLYGIIVFIFAQITFGIMGAIGIGPEMPKDNMMMTALGSIMGHVVYGITLGSFISKEQPDQCYYSKTRNPEKAHCC